LLRKTSLDKQTKPKSSIGAQSVNKKRFHVQVSSEGGSTLLSDAGVLADKVIDAIFTLGEDLESFLRASMAKYIIGEKLKHAYDAHEERLETLTCTCEETGKSFHARLPQQLVGSYSWLTHSM
jgi:hypothetical protein